MHIEFDVRESEDGAIEFLTNAEGKDVIHKPILNKGTAFTLEERDELDLNGLLPPHMLTLEQQLKKIQKRYNELGTEIETCGKCDHFTEDEFGEFKKDIDVARYNFLRDLQDRNEILFYAFASRYMTDVVPIIYTPTVGEAVMRFSRDSARFRGVFLSPDDIELVHSIFDHVRFQRPTLAVVTDNQGILGLGDQGVGGIDIPIGKLALYVLGAGIRPWETLPITLDVGTDNPVDLEDPLYVGYKSGRLMGEEYETFIEQFIAGITTKFPGILIQWEDFSRQNAFTILDKYRDKVLSFNDDIQGTGSMALAGILNAMKCSDSDIEDQRFIIYGSGAGGIGIARQIATCLQTRYGLSNNDTYSRIVALDSKGVLTNKHKMDDYKKAFAKNENFLSGWNVENSERITLLEAVRNFQATVLIGTSGMPGHFTDDIIRSMADNTKRPVIFPLSNPTSKTEAPPARIYRITDGRAIVATGSPFPSVIHNNETIAIGQGNNMYIFPGVGFGAIVGKLGYISDAVFTDAAYALAEITPIDLINKGTIYPPISNIREISARVAHATITRSASEQGIKEFQLDEIRELMWKPQYHRIRKAE